MADPGIASHLIVELCWWAAGRRPVDPHARWITETAARDAVRDFVAAALEGTAIYG